MNDVINEENVQVYIDSVEVKNLFGRISKKIYYNVNKPVSVVIAPNGCGKTTIFNLISFCLDLKFARLKKVLNTSFDTFTLNLTDGRTIVLSKNEEFSTNINKKYKAQLKISKLSGINFSSNEDLDEIDDEEEIDVSQALKEKVKSKFNYFNLKISCYQKNNIGLDNEEIKDIGSESLLDIMLLDEINFNNFLNAGEKVFTKNESEENENTIYDQFNKIIRIFLKKFDDFKKDDKLTFIEANRLYKSVNEFSPFALRRMNNGDAVSSMKAINSIMREIILNNVRNYDRLVSEAKDNLFVKFFEETNQIEYSEFNERWTKYLNKLNDNMFLINLERRSIRENENRIQLKEIDENTFKKNPQFFSIYLKSFEKTIDVIENLNRKIQLFESVYNDNNEATGNVLFINENRSYNDNISPFVIKNTRGDDKLIPLEYLSSGEKNLLSMFFDLIFDTTENISRGVLLGSRTNNSSIKKNKFVLIDEPEISAHIEWQKKYMDKIIEICEQNGMQAIIATHSPFICGNHIDLYVEEEENDCK